MKRINRNRIIITVFIVFLIALLNSKVDAWDGTFVLFIFNSNGITVPTGATNDSMVNGLAFETYLIKIPRSRLDVPETSRVETDQSFSLFKYTVEEIEGRIYAHIDISLGNYKMWSAGKLRPYDYKDGDTIFFRIRDMEEPFKNEAIGYFSCPEPLVFSFTQADWIEPTFAVDTLCLGEDKK